MSTPAAMWPGVDVDNLITTLIDLDDLEKVVRVLQFLPLLRGAILSSITAGNTTFCIHFKAILKEFQMTVFNIIREFLDADYTLLHYRTEVIQDAILYSQTYKRLYDLYGADLGYLKLIDPMNMQTSAGRFPKLTLAAKAWIVSACNIGANTKKNIAGMKTVPRSYVQQAAKVLPAHFQPTGRTPQLVDIKAMFAQMDVDVPDIVGALKTELEGLYTQADAEN